MKRAAFEPLTWEVARLLAERIRQEGDRWAGELVVAPPMHWLRRLQRGTQPAWLLAAEVARSLQIPFAGRLLRCRRSTRKQGTLSVNERRGNVKDAFYLAARPPVAGRSVLVVDDVMTTGATLHEIARLLRRGGARSVSVAVVARGIGQ